MLPPRGRLTVVTPDGVAVLLTEGARTVTAVFPGGSTVTFLEHAE